jgi:glycosyltransferase involved in cell wall biosynthesis
MKILHLVERVDDNYGGPAKSIPYTVVASADDGIQQRILSGRTAGNGGNSVCDRFGLDYIQYTSYLNRKLAFAPGMFWDVYTEIRNTERCVIHLHNPWNFVPFFVWVLRFFYDFKIVFSPRGAMYAWTLRLGRIRKRVAWYIFQRNLMRKADIIHVTSEQERDEIAKLGDFSTVRIIPNGVYTSFTPSANGGNRRSAQNASDGRTRILFLSRIHQKKGLELLLEALESGRCGADIDLRVVGEFADARYRERIERLAARLPAGMSVSFPGHLGSDVVGQEYAWADLFVLPSFAENFGIVIAEALSHGLPVVTTVHTPWSEIAREGAGYVVEPSSDAVESAICDFMSKDAAQRKDMSERAVNLCARYDWTRIGPRYREMYRSLFA